MPLSLRSAAVLGLAALSLSPLLNGLANPRFILFERQLVYSKLAILTLGAKVVSVAITLVIAIALGLLLLVFLASRF